jgi:hypothetical protein
MELFVMLRTPDSVEVSNSERDTHFTMPTTDDVLALFGDETEIYVTGELRHDDLEDEPEFYVQINHGVNMP